MLANVTCPSCKHKFWLPEGEMGSRQTCPNCQTSFFAGASVAEGKPPAASAAALQPSYAKTMIGDPSPPIKYTCPRCKSPLEAPTSEGGTKKNCPNCTQRHQVPPAPAAAAANLNKTMLAGDESAAPRPPIKYNCPNCKRPLEAPAEQGGAKINCPACSQRLQIPAAPPLASNRNKTMLAAEESASPAFASQGYSTDGGRAASSAAAAPTPAASPWARALTPTNVLLAILLLLVLLIVVPAVIRGGKTVDQDAVARMQLELEKMKQDFELKKRELENQSKGETDARKRMDEWMRTSRAEEERRREQDRQKLQAIDDEDRRTAAKKKQELEQQQRERDRLDTERRMKEMAEEQRRRVDELKRELAESQKRQQTIIQQPPPVIQYAPYHPGYYRPWWLW